LFGNLTFKNIYSLYEEFEDAKEYNYFERERERERERESARARPLSTMFQL
jgi:hypothetical protein